MKTILIFFSVLSVIFWLVLLHEKKTSQEIEEKWTRINKNPVVKVFNNMINNATLADREKVANADKLLLTYVITKQSKQNFNNIYEVKFLIASLNVSP
ncbi:hypothetical protein [Pyramidobacter sp.]|uniref:hypothetical protein n=1 Tax=Pyramidobacter sp. TaxID=1943581 RepID=UPI0025D4366B|nr:hypothetical protein [Pyramidobacter sp.]MCI7404134.1 hypothetical protein [Pyramidobacter sp.]MDY3212184.1 hypothetical protein [Pyramidobacter sp.]